MRNELNVRQNAGGILFKATRSANLAAEQNNFMDLFTQLDIAPFVAITRDPDLPAIGFQLHPGMSEDFAPAFDTLQLHSRLQLRLPANTDALEQEIVLSMLLGPVAFEYPSYLEFAASVRIRRNIVEAARRTVLSFHTSKIERPSEYWAHSEEQGFTLRTGRPLIEALRVATQPEISGKPYSFSCYRATEYVILLGIAQELATCNPGLLDELQQHWESQAIMSRQFHEAFLREHGSTSAPLPHKYYVPGDRVWFRNPDERSSDVEGYEGSWVVYLGGGLFCNFWKRDKPYSLEEKCVEIYHWRSAVYRDTQGNLQIDEAVVEARVHATMGDPAELELILLRMMQLRDPSGSYAGGGCLDTSREYPRCICVGTTDILFPNCDLEMTPN